MSLEKLRFSRLKNMAQSPAHYLAALNATFDSAAMKLGRLSHLLTFENAEIAVYEGRRAGKVWESFRDDHERAGIEVFSRSEHDTASNIRESLRSNSYAADLLWRDGATTEHTIEWDIAGRACRGTPDIFDADIIADLKTTQSADPRRWTGRYGEIRKRAYHAQLAWYIDGLDAAGHSGPRPRKAYLVAVESKPPHIVTIYELDASEIEAGRATYRAWLEELRVCEDAGYFPGYSQAPVLVSAPEDDDMPALTFGSDDDNEHENEAA